MQTNDEIHTLEEHSWYCSWCDSYEVTFPYWQYWALIHGAAKDCAHQTCHLGLENLKKSVLELMTIHSLNCLLEALSIYIVTEQYLIIINLLVSIFL